MNQTVRSPDHPPVPKLLGVALVATPVLWLAAEAISPKLEPGARAQLAVVGQNPGAWYTYTLLLTLGTMMFVPAVVALMLLARRSPRFATAGGALLGLGTLVAVGDSMSQLLTWQMVASAADQHQMAALLDRFDNAGGSAAVFGVGGLCFVLGTLLLTVGLIRSRSTSAWAAVLFAVGIVLQLVGFTSSSVPIVMISSVILLAAMGRVAMSVLDVPVGHQRVRTALG